MMHIEEFVSVAWTMNKNKDMPDIRPIDERIYKLYAPVEYRWLASFKAKKGCPNDTSMFRVSISEGFICDGQSVPSIFWSIVKMTPDGICRMAALVHDLLYRTEGGKKDTNVPYELNIIGQYDEPLSLTLGRKACDQMYKAIYIDCAAGNVDEIDRATLGYNILRLAGGMHFGGPVPGTKK
jgi:hypothetical protein